MWRIGKTRSKVGKFIDNRGHNQEDLCHASKVSRNTVSKICSDPDYVPNGSTMKKILKALREIDPTVKSDDFFNI